MLKETPILYSSNEQCCGCTACYAVCPKDAIEMLKDAKGFKYPKINEKICIRCYKCITVCPIK